MINPSDKIQVLIKILNAPENASIMNSYSVVLPAYLPLPRQGEILVIPDNPTYCKFIELKVSSIVHDWDIPCSTAIEVSSALITLHCLFVSIRKI